LRKAWTRRKPIFFAHEGKVTEERQVIAWAERRQYAELAAKYGGYLEEKLGVAVQVPIQIRVHDIGAGCNAGWRIETCAGPNG